MVHWLGLIGGVLSWLVAEALGKVLLVWRVPRALRLNSFAEMKELLPRVSLGRASAAALGAAAAVLVWKRLVGMTSEGIRHSFFWRSCQSSPCRCSSESSTWSASSSWACLCSGWCGRCAGRWRPRARWNVLRSTSSRTWGPRCGSPAPRTLPSVVNVRADGPERQGPEGVRAARGGPLVWVDGSGAAVNPRGFHPQGSRSLDLFFAGFARALAGRGWAVDVTFARLGPERTARAPSCRGPGVSAPVPVRARSAVELARRLFRSRTAVLQTHFIGSFQAGLLALKPMGAVRTPNRRPPQRRAEAAARATPDPPAHARNGRGRPRGRVRRGLTVRGRSHRPGWRALPPRPDYREWHPRRAVHAGGATESRGAADGRLRRAAHRREGPPGPSRGRQGMPAAAHWVIAGVGRQQRELEALAQSLGVPARFAGQVDSAELLRRADIVVVPASGRGLRPGRCRGDGGACRGGGLRRRRPAGGGRRGRGGGAGEMPWRCAPSWSASSARRRSAPASAPRRSVGQRALHAPADDRRARGGGRGAAPGRENGADRLIAVRARSSPRPFRVRTRRGSSAGRRFGAVPAEVSPSPAHRARWSE